MNIFIFILIILLFLALFNSIVMYYKYYGSGNNEQYKLGIKIINMYYKNNISIGELQEIMKDIKNLLSNYETQKKKTIMFTYGDLTSVDIQKINNLY